MYIYRLLILFYIVILSGCYDAKEATYSAPMQIIDGRDEGPSLTRVNLYRVRTPNHWKRIDTPNGESIKDTTLPICEFHIEESGEEIKITLHNFPSANADDRIPPMAQVARWKRQFDSLDPAFQKTQPQSFSGYVGFLYEGKGIIAGQQMNVMGWTLQIGTQHYRVLSKPHFPQQMRADVTIKAVGPSRLLDKHREEIIAFARSFELIEEIPAE